MAPDEPAIAVSKARRQRAVLWRISAELGEMTRLFDSVILQRVREADAVKSKAIDSPHRNECTSSTHSSRKQHFGIVLHHDMQSKTLVFFYLD